MTSSITRVPIRVTVVVATVLIGLSGCTPGSPQPDENGADDSSTVVVEERDIRSVVVLEGGIVSSPEVSLSTPRAGHVDYVGTSMSASTLQAGAVIARVEGVDVPLPFPGRIASALFPNGSSVVANAPLAIANYAGFGIVVDIPAELLYRVYNQPATATAAVTGGPGGITCALLPSPAAQAGEGASVVCLLPLDTDVVVGLRAKIGMQTGVRDNVLALPVTAVLGSSDTGMVTLVRNGERITTSVDLGISDGSYVEITSGLEAGDMVLSHAPVLR